MSQINTNGINVNYPTPGQNNSSQGFRDNFTQIKNGLNTAGTEITDLQNKAVLKAALDNSVLNNDMANTLISNASTRGWRATTYNLGNALSGTVLVDVNKADVHYGTVTANVNLQFGSWAPINTESSVTVRLTVANVDAVISLPSQVISSNNDYGVTILENYASISNTASVTSPANVEVLEYTFSSIDCGETISVSPVNRPYQSTQIITRDPSPVGLPGDVNGTIAVSTGVTQLHVTSSNAADYFTLASGDTTELYPELPVVFTGTSFEANITSGTTYYVRNVVSSNTFTVSSTIGGANVNLAGSTGNIYLNPASYLYVCTGNFSASIEGPYEVQNTFTSTNIINFVDPITGNFEVNAPIVFTGNVFGGLVADTVYYVKTINSGSNITVSRSRVNGVAGAALALSTANGNCFATCYVGSDIWRRLNLTSW
jgi:surface antigen